MKTHKLHPGAKSRYYKLTSQQEELWLHYKLKPQDNSFNTFANYQIAGDLDINKFLDSILAVINFFPSYRTNFSEDQSGNARQLVREFEEVDIIDYRDLTNHSQDWDSNQAEALELIRQNNYKTFDLLAEDAQRFLVIKASPTIVFFSVTQHHINADAYSAYLGSSAIAAVYNQGPDILEEKFSKLGVPEYLKFCQEQKPQEAAKKEYWQGELAKSGLKFDFPGQVALREGVEGARSHNVTQVFYKNETSRLRFILGKNLKRKIRLFCRAKRTTSFLFLTTIFALLLKKHFNKDVFHLGYPVNIRPKGLGNIYGYYVSILPFLFEIDDKQNCLSLLEQVKQKRKVHSKYEQITLSEIVADLPNQRENHFNVSVGQAGFYTNFLKLDNLEVISLATSGAFMGPKHDLSFAYDPETENLECLISYNSTLFSAEQVVLFKEHFVNICKSVLLDPEQNVSEIELLGTREKEKLSQGFSGKREYKIEETILDKFHDIIKEVPNNIAISYEGKEFSYAELNNRAEALAYLLVNKGVTPGDVVAIIAERSPEYVIAILSVMKIGAVFLPLDVQSPRARVMQIVGDAQVKLLLGDAFCLDNINVLSLKQSLIDVDGIKKELIQSYNNYPTVNSVAYIIYTSGTTGVPKGVPIQHCSIANNIGYFCKEFGVTRDDVSLLKTSLAFDVSLQEIFGALCTGGKLVVLSEGEECNLEKIVSLVRKEDISILQFTPSLLKLFLTEEVGNLLNGSRLRCCFVGGENLDLQTAKKFRRIFPQVELINAYGPTEAAIDVLHYRVSNSFKDIYLGCPIDNVKIYVLDEDLSLVPYGVVGQLCISGISVAQGYLGVSESQNFVPNPYARENKYAHLYLTGDLVKLNHQNQIIFCGRKDRQIKLRGYRIECTEIEGLIKDLECVDDVLVLSVQRDRQEFLVAYLVECNSCKLEDRKIRSYLAKSLPHYMIPSLFIRLDKFPLTSSGKVNLEKLPPANFIVDKKKSKLPRDGLETEIRRVWGQVLSIKEDDIGVSDDFFNLGGHSLQAVTLVRKLKEDLNLVLSVENIFQYPTVQGLADIASRGDYKDSLMSTLKVSRDAIGNAFFIHPAGGVINQYYALAKRIDGAVNMYALKSPEFLSGSVKEYNSIAELAKLYVPYIEEKVVRFAEGGRVFIVGWSFGGSIAIEVARMLPKKDLEVVVIDSFICRQYTGNFNFQLEQEALNFILHYFLEVHNKVVVSSMEKKKALRSFVDFFALLKSYKLVEETEYKYFKQIYDTCIKHLKMRYEECVYNGEITFINAKDSKEKLRDFQDIKCVYPKARLYEVEGSHFSVFQNHIQGLSSLVRSILVGK